MMPPRRMQKARRKSAARTATRGVAAMEFAVTMPLLALMMVGLVDLGRAIDLRLRLEADVAAAANLAIVQASQVSSANGATLATSIGDAMGGNLGTTLTSGVVIVNNGPTVTISNGVATASGAAANADDCYCPTGTAPPYAWNSAVTCGSTCTGGGYAGKFVSVSETQSFVPAFSSYGLLPSNQISASAIVQVQ